MERSKKLDCRLRERVSKAEKISIQIQSFYKEKKNKNRIKREIRKEKFSSKCKDFHFISIEEFREDNN